MTSRSGFARLLPLAAILGLGVGVGALLVSARPVQAPQEVPTIIYFGTSRSYVTDLCSAVSPVPAHKIRESTGRLWELADIPGHELRGVMLNRAEWAGVDVHGATFTACNFRRCDLAAADLRDVTFWKCDLTGAILANADLTGATFDRFTRWPAGFDPRAAGARLEE